ncbi:hypothetical protein [Winogradskya humida]|uniref:CMP/dCMP-type deaminase domain-containing protein n=1 Tax=Winogradskya humida TaxID=113566 RepID=A0ABQ4A1S3_9ACTN|nr:hypothetical protein [Actinoplanes humidus]GIE24777.1 hypothetical protein Ahu01nite_078790 [Actinoplanes humidus]
MRKGEPHAEAHAVAAAGPLAAGGTAVVTLEPCNHIGVTPACRQLLLGAGIVRVVIALRDPTSRGDGGIAVLRAAGVDVEVGVLAEEARLVLGPWLVATERGRPWVTWHYGLADREASPAASVDDLRRAADVVVSPDGAVEEGVPGGHGPDRLHYRRGVRSGAGVDVLEELFLGGCRRVLVLGDTVFVRDLLSAGAIDEVAIDVPHPTTTSTRCSSDQATLPSGFVITVVRPGKDGVRLVGRPAATPPG